MNDDDNDNDKKYTRLKFIESDSLYTFSLAYRLFTGVNVKTKNREIIADYLFHFILHNEEHNIESEFYMKVDHCDYIALLTGILSILRKSNFDANSETDYYGSDIISYIDVLKREFLYNLNNYTPEGKIKKSDFNKHIKDINDGIDILKSIIDYAKENFQE